MQRRCFPNAFHDPPLRLGIASFRVDPKWPGGRKKGATRVSSELSKQLGAGESSDRLKRSPPAERRQRPETLGSPHSTRNGNVQVCQKCVSVSQKSRILSLNKSETNLHLMGSVGSWAR